MIYVCIEQKKIRNLHDDIAKVPDFLLITDLRWRSTSIGRQARLGPALRKLVEGGDQASVGQAAIVARIAVEHAAQAVNETHVVFSYLHVNIKGFNCCIEV